MIGVDEVDARVLVFDDDLTGLEGGGGIVGFEAEGGGVSRFSDYCCLLGG